jgi:hypothetical protein
MQAELDRTSVQLQIQLVRNLVDYSVIYMDNYILSKFDRNILMKFKWWLFSVTIRGTLGTRHSSSQRSLAHLYHDVSP